MDTTVFMADKRREGNESAAVQYSPEEDAEGPAPTVDE